jgi:RimJ/RimL family protein N-acetyltransferase
MTVVNEHGQPVGEPLADWSPPGFPPRTELVGSHVSLRPLDTERDTPGLYDAFRGAPDSLWTYMSFGPFGSEDELAATLDGMLAAPDWLPFVIEAGGAPAGFASYLRIVPRDGVIEIGAITLSPGLQRTTAATEAIYLMIRNVFELGYRRCEWKCDDLNEPSRVAAVRFGFTYEGTFRRATHYKGRNRDTAWYAIVDQEWPDLDRSFRIWLDPANFDSNGRQIRSLMQTREES